MRPAGEQSDKRHIVVRRPLPGVMVGRSAGGPLVRAVPDHFGTTLHLAGRSEWRSGHTRWSSRAGIVSVKVPGEVSVENARSGRRESHSVLFGIALVEEARDALERSALGLREHAFDGRDPRLAPLADLHRRLLGGDDEGLEESVCGALGALVDLVFAPRGSTRPSSAFSAAVARSRALLDERLTEVVTLDELAAHARLDKFHLCRAFREQVGLPPHAYVTHRRVSLAQGLLARGVAQAEVAARVGLYDQSLLHRHFKRILGMTPGAFARAVR